MTLASKIGRRLEAAAGAYLPNHFLLTLDKDTPFISGEEPDYAHDDAHLHVFIHEYWHYWQNVSTCSGIKTFILTQKLLAHFGDTLQVRKDGTSAGTDGAGLDHQDDVSAILDLWFDLDGDAAPKVEWESDFDLTFVVDDILERDAPVAIEGVDAPNPTAELRVTATWPDGRSEQGSMLLGARAIEESVAFLVEEQVRTGLTDADLSPPPEFPYRVIERVLSNAMGECSDFTAASLGTLALLLSHPGPALITLAQAMRRMAEDDGIHDEIERLNRLVLSIEPQITRGIEVLLSHDLPELVEMHRGRGLAEAALGHLQRVVRNALLLRRASPIIDVQHVFPRARAGHLMLHQTAFPPCDLLQERAGGDDEPMRDVLFGFDTTAPDAKGLRPTDFMRAFQAQQEFLFAHLDLESGKFQSSENSEARCPYYTACVLPFRRNSEDVCREAPWRAWQPGKPGCSYALAVAATLGSVDVGGKLEP